MTKKILQFLKSLISCSKYTLGYVEEEVENSLCVFHRSGYQGTFEYGKAHSTSIPLTIIYTGTGNYTETEDKILKFYNDLVFTEHIQIDEDLIVSFLPNNDSVPQFLSKNEAGFYQWAIDVNVHVY